MKFYIETLGCKVNAYESNYMSEILTNNNYIPSTLNESDIVILNTCSVTNSADNKSLKIARKIRRENPNCLFIVCGCSSQNDKDKYEDIDINILIGTKDKSIILTLIEEYFATNENYHNICNPDSFQFEDMRLSNFNQVRAYIKIQDGCNNYCSFCVIPYVRGNQRSKDYDLVLNEAKSLAENNYKEIVLTGIHTGSYNSKGKTLFNLIDELSKIDNIKRIRLSSIEITELDDDFISLFESNKVLCDNLHIPLQSGSDTILKRMNRKYDTNYYREKIKLIRSIRSDIYISTDLIIGHPYETEELFLETVNFLKEINFSKVHVFPYSKREGTVSAKMPNHISDVDKKRRVKEILELNTILEENYNRKFIGKTLDVLIDEVHSNYVIGHTSNFLKLKLDKKYNINDIVNVLIDEDMLI